MKTMTTLSDLDRLALLDDLIERCKAWAAPDCPASRIMLDDRELRTDMNEASAELTRLRERVKELEAENARLKESLWGNDQWNGSRVPHGWRCNACGRVNSPGVRHCSCNGNKTLRERVSTP